MCPPVSSPYVHAHGSHGYGHVHGSQHAHAYAAQAAAYAYAAALGLGPPPGLASGPREAPSARARGATRGPELVEGLPLADFIVSRLARVSCQDELAQVVQIVLPEMPALACDANAHTMLLKLFDVCGPELRSELARTFKGSMLKLSRDRHGCRIVQSGLEGVPLELQEELTSEIRTKVLFCTKHLHANFVLQKCVQLLPPHSIGFIVEELEAHATEASMHAFGCRVVQRLIEHASHERQLPRLLQALLSNIPQMAKDSYGANVLRSLLEHGSVAHQRAVMKAMGANVLEFAKTKNSSLVLEKCLEVSSFGQHSQELEQDRAELMEKFIGTDDPHPPFVQIMLHHFGNYIAQRVMTCSRGFECHRLQVLLWSAVPKLCRSTNGKHILATARKKWGFVVAEH